MPSIYLVGFMGTGKTQTAKVLARRLNRTCVDMDEVIVARQKMPISEIFKSKGEPYFRKLEKDLVGELVVQEGLIVACGGGVFVDEENIKKLKEAGIVICLLSSPEVILKRTKAYKARPLLNVDNPKARIEELLEKRMPYYSRAHHMVDADRLTVEETASEILKMLKLK